jgi:hypothetical protein
MDCLSMINNLEQAYAVTYNMVIDDIKVKSRTLVSVSFKHENQASNMEPHRLARLAVSSPCWALGLAPRAT